MSEILFQKKKGGGRERRRKKKKKRRNIQKKDRKGEVFSVRAPLLSCSVADCYKVL